MISMLIFALLLALFHAGSLHNGYIDGLVQDCGISIAKLLEISWPCSEPSILMGHIAQEPLLGLLEYCPGSLSYSQVSANLWKITHPWLGI